MAGDCISSFVKRRLGLKASSIALGLDQVPEALFPAVACAAYLPLGPIDVFAIVFVFTIGHLAISRLRSESGPTEAYASELVQRDFRPIVESHRNDRRPRPS